VNQRLLICLFFATTTFILLAAVDSAFFPVLAARGPIISTVAGGGGPGYCGDGPAISACLNFPIGATVNGNNNVFIADSFNNRIRQFKSTGTINTVAGNGTFGFCGDNGPATSACLNVPEGVDVDESGNLFIADTFNHRIRRVDSSGTITTVAGNGTAGLCGDNGAATDACLNGPTGVALDNNDLFIVDQQNSRVRRVH